MIEALPFLNENSIVVLHDISWHLYRIWKTNLENVKIKPTQIYLMSVLLGEKILINNKLYLRIFDNSVDYNKKYFHNLYIHKYKLN